MNFTAYTVCQKRGARLGGELIPRALSGDRSVAVAREHPKRLERPVIASLPGEVGARPDLVEPCLELGVARSANHSQMSAQKVASTVIETAPTR